MSSHPAQARWSPSIQALAPRAVGAVLALGALAGLLVATRPHAPSAADVAKARRQAVATERDAAFMASRGGLESAIRDGGARSGFMVVEQTTIGRRKVFTVAQAMTGCHWVVESEAWDKAPLNPVSVEPKSCGVSPSQARPISKEKVDALFMANAPELARVARGGWSQRFALVDSSSATRSADRVVMIDASTGCRLIGRMEKFGAGAPMPDGVGLSCKD